MAARIIGDFLEKETTEFLKMTGRVRCFEALQPEPI
jgi:hypothetical protein